MPYLCAYRHPTNLSYNSATRLLSNLYTYVHRNRAVCYRFSECIIFSWSIGVWELSSDLEQGKTYKWSEKFGVKWSESHSVVSNSLWPHGLYSPWNSPGQNTEIGSHSLLQGIFLTQRLNPVLPHCRQILYQLSNQRSPRVLEWQAYSFSKGSSQPRNWTGVSCIAGGFFTNWATREAWRMKSITEYLLSSLYPNSHSFFFNLILFNFTILYWFCHISKWICHRYTCVPHPEPSSLLPPHIIPLGRPSAPAPSIQYCASNLDWQLVSYMILYIFQCHSPKSSHPLPQRVLRK